MVAAFPEHAVQHLPRLPRQPLPDKLERIETTLEPEEKTCPACGRPRQVIGQEVSEQLEYLPASFKVLRHIRHKYGYRRCEHDGYNPQIAAAAKPARVGASVLPSAFTSWAVGMAFSFA